MVADGFGGLCENGHDVTAGSTYCPQCGSMVHAPVDDRTIQRSAATAQDAPPPPGSFPPPPPPGSFPPPPPPGSFPPPVPPGGPQPGAFPAPPYGPGGPAPGPYGGQPPYPPPPPFAAPPYGPSPYYQQPYYNQGYNGLAIASMVLGILWLYWVGSILAVIFGHVALHQISRDGKQGRGMAIAGLVLGYIGLAALVVVIIVAIVAAANSSSNSMPAHIGSALLLGLGRPG
jgi:hypothetical protein